MAWNILSATHKVSLVDCPAIQKLRAHFIKIFLAQRDRDNAVNHLLEVMADVYAFVLEADSVKEIKSHERILAVMVRQTTECAYFIREYAMNKSFSMSASAFKRTKPHHGSHPQSNASLKMSFRTLTTKLSNTKINSRSSTRRFKNGLSFKPKLQSCASLVLLKVWVSILRRGRPLYGFVLTGCAAEDVDFSGIPYAAGARFNRDKRCLQGTREKIIDEITQWINSPNSDEVPRVYFLNGLAGTGKSAIAHTIASQFEQLGRLGSSFCFDRTDQVQRRPNNMFSTIALDIADLDYQWKTSLRNVVRGKRALRSTLAPEEQFTNFILKPSEALTTVGPVVIVIDALDESGDQVSRAALLNIIAKRMCDLPVNFRVLVTSRPELDIYEALSGKRHVLCNTMDSIDKKANEADISLFIQAQLSDVPGLDLEWPHQEWCRLLLNSSDGLFQWAFTACSAIKGSKGALRPAERLTRFITSAHGLDGLYAEILSQGFDSTDSQDMARFTLVMGRILTAKEPLSVASLSELRSDGEQADLVELVVRPLASLLSGVTRKDAAVRPLHASLSDFLTCKKRSGCYYVDLSPQHGNLAWACWRVLKAYLRFNICELQTSHLRNADVPDMDIRISRYIPVHLSYACRFWEDHARAMPFEPAILEIVRGIFVDHFLAWLEVLSLIGRLSTASSALQSSHDWVKVDLLPILVI
jgi:hypothetical protein